LKTAEFLASCLLILPAADAERSSMPDFRARSLSVTQEAHSSDGGLNGALRQTGDAFRSGEYQYAMQLARAGYREALAVRNPVMAARFLGNLGGARFALHQLDAALQAYLRAYELARQAGDLGTAATLTANIASLYFELGELAASAEWLENSAKALSATPDNPYLSRVKAQLATVRARQDRMAEAKTLFAQALDAADRAGDFALYTLIWNRVGEEYLRRGDLDRAETALLEAWRVRVFRRVPLDASYFLMGKLRFARGDLRSAGVLLDHAVEEAVRPGGATPGWEVYHARARVRLAQGCLAESLGDARIAVRLARAWRWSTPADEASRIGTEGILQQVYSTLIEAGNRLCLRTGDNALLRETLEAAEENRAFSLRAMVSDPGHGAAQLPGEYWEGINRLQRAELEALRHPGPATDVSVAAVRAELVRMEAGLGPGATISNGISIAAARAALDRDSALLCFHLDENNSWLWALDRDHIYLYALPSAREIEAAIDPLTAAIREDSPGASPRSRLLYELLFGKLNDEIRRKPRWVVAQDAGLFRLPLAALVVRHDGVPLYLGQAHAIQVIPSVALLADRDKRTELAGSFVGLGDAIYNTADSRYSGRLRQPIRAHDSGFRLFASSPPEEPLALPRLVSSGAEIAVCARVWGRSDSLLLSGAEASKARLRGALERAPSVVHIAAHVVQSSQRPGYGLMVLSLDPSGRAEVVTPYEIARWRTGAGLVVLSGCASAAGAALPGTGLLGLTRAWLAAGAGSVIASQWPTPDDEGALFLALYRRLRAEPRSGIAEALRSAQQSMIGAGGWRSRPRYWGAYFVVGRG